MKIYFDTNFLIDLYRFKIDPSQIYDLYPSSKFATTSPVIDELKKISKKKTKEGGLAKLALEFSKKFKIIKSEDTADISLLKLADKETIIATNDLVLRNRMRIAGNKSIFIRAKKKIDYG